MIETIIFDFGNVFINLEIESTYQEVLKAHGINTSSEAIINTNRLYETGRISTEEFVDFYAEKFPDLNRDKLIALWNLILKDFPEYRLDFLKELKKNHNFKLILLSNTNMLHIDWIKENVPFYNEFKNCFDAFYLSHEIHLRKPNASIFEFVLEQNHLNAKTCLFIDDNADNITTAKTLDIKTWHITPYKEDVVNLFSNKSSCFNYYGNGHL